MGNSIAERAQATCPTCERAFVADLWVVVDEAERPDLIELARERQLHDLVCPECGGTAGHADSALIIYRPGRTPRFLYAPSSQPEEDNVPTLLVALRERLGEAWRDEWATSILRIDSAPLLPVALSDDPDVLAKLLLDETAREMTRLKQDRPDLHGDIRSAFGMLK
jgi:hypothetical protein